MLSEFLKGRYGLSRAKAAHVADMMELGCAHTSHFVDLLEAHFHRSKNQRQMAQLRIDARTTNSATHLSSNTLKGILDWTYFALLEVIGLEGGKIQAEGWSAPFRSSLQSLQNSVERLLELKLLRTEDNSLVPSTDVTIACDPLPEEQIQMLHHQVLELSAKALSEMSPVERENYSIFASIDSADLPDLKRELNDVFLQLLNKYSGRPKTDSVFCFALQVFPIYRKR